MAEDHRRVESRQIVGTGMATDAERITRIADDAARRERAWRNAPDVAFGDVLVHTPARGAADDDGGGERRNADAEAIVDGDGDGPRAESSTALMSPSTTTKPAPRAPLRSALRAPDPRARLLHAQVAARAPAPPAASTTRGPSLPSSSPQRTGRPGPRE